MFAHILFIIEGKRENIELIYSIQLREVLILTLLCLKESGFNLCHSLVIALKPHPDLLSSSTIRDSIKLRKGKTRKENTTSLGICVVLADMLLTNMSSKHLEVRILANLPNSLVNALKMRRHADLPVGVICSIEERRFVGTTLYVIFMYHGPIKVE